MRSQLKLWLFLGAFLMLLIGSKSTSAHDVDISQTGGGSGISVAAMRRLLLLLAILLSCLPAMAATTYVSQSGGAFSGGTACNGQTTVSIATFNSSTPAAGTQVWICGTLTTAMKVGGSGSSGNPITITFDTGAQISMGACGSTGCINIAGLSYIIIDGGTNGIIQATNSGSGLGNGDSNGIYARSGINHCEIRNLTIENMYVMSSNTDAPPNNYYAIWMDGTNNLIHNNTFHDDLAGIKIETPASGNQYYQNTIYNCNWGIAEIGGNSSTTNGNTLEKFYENNIYNFANWDTTADTFHHDGIFAAGGASDAEMSNFDIYDNYIHGSASEAANCPNDCMTAFIYINTANNMRDYNNLLVANPGDYVNNGWIYHFVDASDSIFNNTVIGGTSTSGGCVHVSSTTTVSMENNVLSNCGTLIWTDTNSSFTVIDYNIYQDASLSSGIWQLGSTYYTSLAAWRTAINGDAHAQATTASLGLSGSYAPLTGSILVGAGANLTSLDITALDSDKNGVARLSSGAWDVGAFVYTAPATALAAAPH